MKLTLLPNTNTLPLLPFLSLSFLSLILILSPTTAHAQAYSSVTPGPPIWISTQGPEGSSSTPGGTTKSTRQTTPLPSSTGGGVPSGIVTIQTSTDLPATTTQTFVNPAPSSSPSPTLSGGPGGGNATTQVGQPLPQPSGSAPAGGNGTDTSAAGVGVAVARGAALVGVVAVLWANVG